MHNLYLNILGNVQAGFKPKLELDKLEIEKGGPDQLSSMEIFDKAKYLEMMKSEGTDYQFMESFVNS